VRREIYAVGKGGSGMSYEKLKEPKLIDFDEMSEPCNLKYCDGGSRSDGDSGDKCKSRSKHKDDKYCNCCDCPLCECVNLHDLSAVDSRAYMECRDMVASKGHSPQRFDFKGADCLNRWFGVRDVIQYYEVP